MTFTRCATGWQLSEALRDALAAANGRKTTAYQTALDELRAHLAACPDCRERFQSIPVEGKATVEINPDL